ncbi:MAG: GTPase Era [Clostridia bacterium]|nr:GTPase Era [Clostridia bacterium]
MKSGFVAIIGRPNAGKSTLLNAFTGEKIAVISDKPQTTRNNILGIVNEKGAQVVFMDTPGIHRPKNKLGEFMVKEAENSVKGVDAIILVVSVDDNPSVNDDIINNIKNTDVPVILVVNKTDSTEKEKILPLIADYSQKMSFDEIIPISALKGDGVDIVYKEILNRLEEGPMYFPDDMVTDQPERQIVSEIVREKALWCLDKEVPHGIAVEITEFKERNDSSVYVGVTINCEKKSHKGIIIGKNGSMLKRIGQKARIDCEKFLGTKVYLEIWVKIKEDWRNSDFLIKNFGFDNKN